MAWDLLLENVDLYARIIIMNIDGKVMVSNVRMMGMAMKDLLTTTFLPLSNTMLWKSCSVFEKLDFPFVGV